jgi:hypothetical protein
LLNRKPKVVAIVPSFIASCQINVIKPLQALVNRGLIQLEVKQETRANVNCVHQADLVVFCRNTEPSYAYLLNEAVSTNKPIIYDLDDNFWDVPFETDPELARYHRLPLRIQQLEKYLSKATLVRVYSPVMGEIIKKFNDNVKFLKAGFDFDLLPAQKSKSKNDKIRVVYATSRTVDNQYKLFSGGLFKALEQLGDSIEFTIWGCQPGDLIGQKGIQTLPLIGDYEDFLRQFARQSFDIGLAPMEDTAFYRSKTNTKFRDYGACRVAGIYSNVQVYADCVENNRTGLLVENTTEGWYEGISALVKDQKLRESIQKNAYEQVHTYYRQQIVEDQWLEQIEQILAADPCYSLTHSPSRQVTELLIRADRDNFSGVTLPLFSPGKELALGNLFLEILTADNSVIREASSTQPVRDEKNGVAKFNFSPIRNSHHKEFVLRFISAPSSTTGAAARQWQPVSGFVHMQYGGVSAKVGALT